MNSHAPTGSDRQLLVARLAGYLDAVASSNGRFHEYVASVVLLNVEPEGIEATVRGNLAKWHRKLELIAIRRGESWTEVEPFLRSVILTEPFGDASLGHLPQLAERRSRLAFQASDLIMLLAADQQPKGILHLAMTHELAVAAAGCAIEYEQDILFLVHVQWRSDA